MKAFKQIIKHEDGNILIHTKPNGTDHRGAIQFNLYVVQSERAIFQEGQLSGAISPCATNHLEAVKEHSLFIVGLNPETDSADAFLSYDHNQIQWAKKYADVIAEARNLRFPEAKTIMVQAPATPAPATPAPELSKLETLRAELMELELRKAELESDTENFDLDTDIYEEFFQEWLDDGSTVDIIGLGHASASYILREVDPSAYRQIFNDFMDDMDKENDPLYQELAENLEEVKDEISDLEEKIEEAEEEEMNTELQQQFPMVFN